MISILDLLIIIVYSLFIFAIGVYLKRYVNKFNTFILADQSVDVYLGTASLMATEFGLVTAMYTAEMGYREGFSGLIAGVLGFIVMIFIGFSGFVIKPLRNAGVATVPELLESRYNKKVRMIAGFFVALGGILNMGIFWKLSGIFLATMLGIPLIHLKWVMTGILCLTLLYTIMGGMLSVLVTDLLQFLFMGFVMILMTMVVGFSIGWENIFRTVETQIGTGGFNPFINKNMGFSYLIWQLLIWIAGQTTWQTTISRALSAKDAKTALSMYKIASFYYVGRFLIPGLWGIAALAYFSGIGKQVENPLLAMPNMIAAIIPVGLIGVVIAGMLAAQTSTDNSYLLAWSTVIVKDLIEPIFPKCQGKISLFLTRLFILLIGIFLIIWGMWYELPGKAWDYLMITGSIYLASIATLIVAGLYWKKANVAGAISALILGAITPIIFLSTKSIPVAIAGILSFTFSLLGMIIGSVLGGLRRGR